VRLCYANKRLEKSYTNLQKLKLEIGPDLTKKVAQRINEFEAADNFGIYLQTGLGKPHLLEDFDKSYGVSLSANIRIIVKPLVDTWETEEIKKCKVLQLGGIVDYHGEKENWYIK
jgi:proteic killer suppression protein/toxin YoeB